MLILLMCNLLEYCNNYFMASGSLWNYYKDEVDEVNDNASDGTSFKYKTKITEKAEAGPAHLSENKNLRYMIDPTFRNINRLFVLLFKNDDNNSTRNSFDKYYTP